MKTFGELKALIPYNTTIPPKKLVEANLPPILEHYEDHKARITVYSNGWVFYEEGKRHTCFNIFKYSRIVYDLILASYEVPSDRIVIEDSYIDSDWIVPISVFAQNRLERHQQINYRKKNVTNEEGKEYENAIELRELDENDTKEKLTLIRKGMKLLSPRQREIIELYYGSEDPSERDIASCLNICQTTVHEARIKAINILKKYCGM